MLIRFTNFLNTAHTMVGGETFENALLSVALPSWKEQLSNQEKDTLFYVNSVQGHLWTCGSPAPEGQHDTIDTT